MFTGKYGETELLRKGLPGATLNVSFFPFDFNIGVDDNLYSEYILDDVGFMRGHFSTSCVFAERPEYGVPIRVKKRSEYSSILDIVLWKVYAKQKKRVSVSAEKI